VQRCDECIRHPLEWKTVFFSTNQPADARKTTALTALFASIDKMFRPAISLGRNAAFAVKVNFVL
jgi:hypothetical protein